MLAKINSAATYGLESLGVTVEVNIASRGLPSFDIVGLPNKAIDESRHRIKAGLINQEIGFPSKKRITVNLAPADIPKQGSFYDLPIATGIFCLTKGLKIPSQALFFGELSLDGSLRHTKGAFLLGLYAKSAGYTKLFVPASNAYEVAAIPGLQVYPVQDLVSLYNHFLGYAPLIPADPVADGERVAGDSSSAEYDISSVIGQEKVKRALEIAAAGGHNFLMTGPPGAGKSMLAKAFCSILPPLSLEESLEVTKIYSAAGAIPPGGTLIKTRPFRSPHHTISYAGMVGGGNIPKPGEISLAHRGVLFMDEFAEFPRSVLEMLRQPLEDGTITISRSKGSFSFPCRFILLASSNPCPCGFFGSTVKECQCTPGQLRRYQKKISGPIMDRIDLFSLVKPVEISKLRVRAKVPSRREASLQVQARVIKARKIQLQRFADRGIFCNGEMRNSEISQFCSLGREEERMLAKAAALYAFSARSYFKVIKVARTIADLEGSTKIKSAHLAEALQYRKKDP